jgi:hypothetical protein
MPSNPKIPDGVEGQLGYIAGKMEGIEGTVHDINGKVDDVKDQVTKLNTSTVKKDKCYGRHQRLSEELKSLAKFVDDEITTVTEYPAGGKPFDVWDWAKKRIVVILGVAAILTMLASAYRNYLKMEETNAAVKELVKKNGNTP